MFAQLTDYANLCGTDVTPEPLEVMSTMNSVPLKEWTVLMAATFYFKSHMKNPIVFLMSTIDPDDIVNSVPTKASVATIWDSKKGATIESESMPGTSTSDRMSPIYYFVYRARKN